MMTAETLDLKTIAFLVGCAFLGLGVLGGGIKVKECEVPKLPISARIGSIAMGSLMLLIGLGFVQISKGDSKTDGNPAPVASASPSSSTKSVSIGNTATTPLTPETTTTPSPTQIAPQNDIALINQNYAKWKAAWLNKDLDSYMSLYEDDAVVLYGETEPHTNFHTKTQQRSILSDVWADHRRRGITYQITNEAPQISINGNKASFSCLQRFVIKKADGHPLVTPDAGQQKLIWIKNNGRWLITRQDYERWQ